MAKDNSKNRNPAKNTNRPNLKEETTGYNPITITEDLLNIIAHGATATTPAYQLQQAERLLTASRLLSRTINKTAAVKIFAKHTGLSIDMARRYVTAAEQYLGEIQPVQKLALREMLVQKHMGIYRQAVLKYNKNEAEHPNIAIKYLETAQRAIEAIGKLYDMRDKQTPKPDNLAMPTILLSPEIEIPAPDITPLSDGGAWQEE